jgi:SAM-dependent methyltransferase
MLDVVEHLYPTELHRALCDLRRVLKPGGRLIIHTMPNTWYYRFGYPAFRFVERIRGKRLPADPRDRWAYLHEVHVNEQNLFLLRRELRRAGFSARVYLRSVQSYTEEPNRLVRRIMRLLATMYPFRWIFCNDLFAVATK